VDGTEGSPRSSASRRTAVSPPEILFRETTPSSDGTSGADAEPEGAFVDYIGLERDQETIVSIYRDSRIPRRRPSRDHELRRGKDTVVAHFTIAKGSGTGSDPSSSRELLTSATVVLRENTITPGVRGEADLLKFQQSVYGTGCTRACGCSASSGPERI